MPLLDQLCARFLAGYEEIRPVDPARLAVWDALLGTKDILDCWRKVKFEHLDRRMCFLRRRLDLGLSALDSGA
jgi:Ser/Thr protein kinase RdoA (MazF antagonist)